MVRLILLILLSLLATSTQAEPKGTIMTDISQTAYLSGGCFWGMEDLVRKIPGVVDAEVGFTGGAIPNATYDIVKTGVSGHAESLKIVLDPKHLTYRHLLFEFFRMHNPTTTNRQGNDVGTQYRSAIFYLNEEQKRTAEEVINTVDASGDWKGKVVTEVVQFRDFWRAEEFHQRYLYKNPGGYTCHYVRRLQLGE
jgi:peptide-methionine (S)-S-oxide reductase/peptide methionine sulfoxide reductase msrA/msrB